jgi:hypothetical protein
MVGIEGDGAGIGGVVGLCFWSCRSKEVAKRFSKSHVARARTSLSVTLELGEARWSASLRSPGSAGRHFRLGNLMLLYSIFLYQD